MQAKLVDELIASAPEEIRKAWLKLNPMQKALAAALPTAASKTEAMRTAGYSENVAKKKNAAIAPEVEKVAAFIAGASLKAAVADVAETLGELSHAIRFDPIDCFDENDCLLPISKWPARARRALASLDVFEEWTKGKDPEFLGRTKKVKFVGKVEAADKVLRALGAYAPEKVEHTHRIEGMAGLLARIAEKGADVGPGPAASRR